MALTLESVPSATEYYTYGLFIGMPNNKRAQVSLFMRLSSFMCSIMLSGGPDN